MERSYREASFEELDILTSDPLVDRLEQQAAEIARLLNRTTDVNQQEIADLTSGLDEQWPYIGSRLIVSGRVSVPDVESGDIVSLYVEDEELISNGFCFQPEPVEFEGEQIGVRYVPKYHVIQVGENGARRFGTAGFDDVVIDFPAESIELIERRLRHFHPDVMADVDTRLLNAETDAEATLALADWQIRFDVTNDDDMRFKSDLEHYITSILDYDTVLPYLFTVKNKFYVLNDEHQLQPVARGSQLSGVLTPEHVRLLPKQLWPDSPEDASVKFVAHIESNFYTTDRTKDVKLYIPVKSLEHFVSIRDVF